MARDSRARVSCSASSDTFACRIAVATTVSFLLEDTAAPSQSKAARREQSEPLAVVEPSSLDAATATGQPSDEQGLQLSQE